MKPFSRNESGRGRNIVKVVSSCSICLYFIRIHSGTVPEQNTQILSVKHEIRYTHIVGGERAQTRWRVWVGPFLKVGCEGGSEVLVDGSGPRPLSVLNKEVGTK